MREDENMKKMLQNGKMGRIKIDIKNYWQKEKIFKLLEECTNLINFKEEKK